MCNSHEIRAPSCFSVYFSKAMLLLALIRNNFGNLTVMIIFWKEIMRLGIERPVPLDCSSAIFWEPLWVRRFNNYRTNSTSMAVFQQPPWWEMSRPYL